VATIVFDPTEFKALYPQFASYADIKLQATFDLSTAYISPDISADFPEPALKQALNLMTAHQLAIEARLVASGYSQSPAVLQSATVDKISVTVQPPPQRDQWAWWLNTTPYGAQLLALLQVQSAGGWYIGGLPERAAFRKVGGVF